LTITFASEKEAKQASNYLQQRINLVFEGHKIKITKPLDSIKERPNDSDNNGSDPSKSQNENSGSNSQEEYKDLQFLD
jgi:hypothetical protein